MTGGEGLEAMLVSPSPWGPLGPRSGEILFLRCREVGVDTGVDDTAGVVVSDVSCCGCLAPDTKDFTFPVGPTGSGV